MALSFPLAEIAARIGAQIEGSVSHNLPIMGISTLRKAGPQELSFYSNGIYQQELGRTQAAAVILSPKDRHYCKVAMLVMSNPYLGYARAATLFYSPICEIKGIHPTAWISPEAVLGSNVSVGAQSVIEAGTILGEEVIIGPGCIIENGVQIGDHCHLRAKVTLCSGTRLGKRVLIHPGAVIGSDGFGLANEDGKWVKVPQIGGVIIANDVEIGANTTIDKGALEDTVIGEGVKLDNQIQIGHNVQIGEHTAIAGCVGIAGSTKIGHHCMIAGGVGIVGHIEIVDHVHITGGSIVLQSILKPGVYSSGTPLQLNKLWHRNYHRFKQLEEIMQRLKVVENRLK